MGDPSHNMCDLWNWLSSQLPDTMGSVQGLAGLVSYSVDEIASLIYKLGFPIRMVYLDYISL